MSDNRGDLGKKSIPSQKKKNPIHIRNPAIILLLQLYQILYINYI